MDNRQIDITSEGEEDFNLAMRLAMKTNETVGYRIFENNMILYWSESKHKEFQPLPYKMNYEQTVNFVWGWLEKTKPLLKEPDHDGDNAYGFHIYNESWGRVCGEWQAFIAIEPIWAMYGK